jgi:A nuclease family of the HNH/ENDO VII superfamily with conserved AHH
MVAPRRRLSFRAVNRRGAPDYDPGLQRHHLLPRQLLSRRCFGPMFDQLGRDTSGFEDFRSNGLLLPASERAAQRLALPLHRGPHRDYNALVIERVGGIEADWSRTRLRAPEIACDQAQMRLALLQRALRRRLLDPPGRRLKLNRNDPFAESRDFSGLDAMAELLWGETGTTV